MHYKTILSTVMASTAFMISPTVSANSGAKMAAHSPTTAGAIVMPASYHVELNRTEVLHLPQAAAAIVVGNPAIADISVHSENTLFLVGRGYGDTNIIILNKAGETVMNANIAVVGNSSRNNVRVFGGGSAARMTYNCSPHCQPSPILGDDTGFIASNSSQSEQISNTFASGSSLPQAPTINLANESYESAGSYSIEALEAE